MLCFFATGTHCAMVATAIIVVDDMNVTPFDHAKVRVGKDFASGT
jgi:hypothetical protein